MLYEVITITTSVSSFGWELLDRLIAIKKYGLIFLSLDEYRLVYKNNSLNYYKFILKSAFLRTKDTDFWHYHKNGLTIINHSFRNNFV